MTTGTEESTRVPATPTANRTPPLRRSRRSAQSWTIRATSLVAAVLSWHLLTTYHVRAWLRFDRLPGPIEVYHAFARQLGTPVYYVDVVQSLVRILSGFVIASIAGVTLGILIARVRWAADVLQPWFEVVRPIPAIALVPLAILLFPANEPGIVFITATAAFFPILVSTRHAVRALPTVWEDALRTMGASRARLLSTVVLPGIVPGVFGGLSVGMGVAWICVISAEMISGDFGIGYRTWRSFTVVDYPAVIVGMLTIGAIGWLTSAGVELVGRRLTRWLASEQRSNP